MTAPTKPASAPVHEIGYQQAVGQYMWWLYENETTPELIWPQSVYVYDQMRRTDSQVGSILRAVNLLVLRTPWRIDPNGARAEVVELVANDLGLPIVGQSPKAPPRTKDRFSWKDHLTEALLMLPLGYSYFEQVYRIDPDGGRAHLRKLALRPARTIEYVNVADDGGLVSIKQYWVRSGERPQPIPVDHLVAYIHAKEGGNWLGTSILRNCYKNWLLKDRLLRVQAQTIERNGMGIPLYTGPEGATDLSAGLAMAKAWRAGEAAGSAVPYGATLKLVGVEGTLPNAEPAIRYHDESIAKTVLAHFLNLGQQMGTGSYALGATLGDFFTLGVQTVAQQIADVANSHVVEDLVDINFGEDEPAPRIVFDEIGSRQAATAQALKVLIDSGVIHSDDILEESTRQRYGLPPRDPNAPPPGPLPGLTRETLTGPAPGTAPADNAQMGAQSVAAKSDPKAEAAEAADAVAAKFNPGELRVPGGEHGGEWSAGGALKDVLKLADRVKLGDGEKLVGSDKIATDQGTIRLAATRKDGATSLRLGVGDSAFGSRDDETGPWRAGPDETARINAERAPLRAERDALAHAPETPENNRRHAELDGMDLQEVYASGYTAKLDAATAVHLRDLLADASKRAKLAAGPHAARWDAIPTGAINPDVYEEIAKGSIPAEWGDIHYETFIDEPEAGPRTLLWVVPPGMTSEEVRNAEQHASFGTTEVAKLIRLLDKMTANPVQAAAADEDLEAYDDDTDALLAALAAFAGEVIASEFDPLKHPRGPGGRFRSTFDKVMHALDGWSKGNGHDDPLKDFNREQLRGVAVKRGIQLKRGESREGIRDALLADLKVKVRDQRDNPTPKPNAKFTLKGGKHRNKDVGVYQEADGKVSLYEESGSGARGARVVTVDDLAGLERWANDNGETELATWARTEGGTPSAPAKKAVPKADVDRLRAQRAEVDAQIDEQMKSGNPDFARVDALQAQGRDLDEQIATARKAAEVPAAAFKPKNPAVDADIRTAVAKLTGRTDLPGGRFVGNPDMGQPMTDLHEGFRRDGWVFLADLRADLGEKYSRPEVDAALGDLVRDPSVRLLGLAARGALSERDHDSELKLGSGDRVNMIKVEPPTPDPSPRPLPTTGQPPAPAKATPKAAPVPTATKGHAALDAAPISMLSNLERPKGAKPPTASERAAFDSYGSDGQAINARLRGGGRITAPIAQMDAAMARSPLSSDVELWRGVSGGSDLPGLDLAGDVIGAEFTDRSFVSTSVNRQVAERFAQLPGSGPSVVLRVSAPQGTGAVAFSGAGGITEAQGELLLERGLTFRVTADHGTVDGLRHLDVEVAPKAAPAAKPPTASTPDATLATLRDLGSHDEVWSAASRMTVPQLKALMQHMGGLGSGNGLRKGVLVDRLAGTWPEMRVDAKPAPNVPAALPPTLAETPRTGAAFTGRDISAEVNYEALPAEYNLATNQDDALGEILRRQGFDGRPVVVSAAEFDATLRRGEVRETWRGLTTSPFSHLTPEQMAEEYRTGVSHAGTGINGNGTYVAARRADGEYYGSTLLRIGLRKDARVISADDLDAEMDAFFGAAPEATQQHRFREQEYLARLAKAKSPRARANLRRQYRADMYGADRRTPRLAIHRDPGRFAALRGYDAIEIPKERSPDKHAELIILNRAATIVQEAQ